MKTLEEIIESAAWRIVNGGEGYHKVSYNSERAYLNNIVATLLHNAVTILKEEKHDILR